MSTEPEQTLPLLLREFSDDPKAMESWTQDRIKGACAMLLEEGRVAASIFFLAPHPEDPMKTVEAIFPLWLFTSSSEEKDQGCFIAGRVIQEMRAFACFTVMETWVTRVQIGSAPERGEALVFLHETLKGLESSQIRFSRDAEGKILLGEQTILGDVSCTGRFTRFLMDAREARKAAQN